MRKVELVTRDELEDSFRDCLVRHEMPDCFLYLDQSGVSNWLSLSESEDFPIASRLTELLKRNVPSIARRLPNRFDLVSIGVGGGQKESMLLEALVPGKSITYYPVDISTQMVDEALKAAAHINVNRTGLVCSVADLSLMRQFWTPPVLLCLLGNNFCNYEPHDLLTMVRRELQPRDFFLFDCHLLPANRDGSKPGREVVERMYRSRLNVQFNIHPLVQRGMAPDGCVFNLDVFPVETSLGTVYRTHKWLRILRHTTVSCGTTEVSLAPGDTIRLGFTYKYTRTQIEAYLRQQRFQVEDMFASDDSDYLLALVRKQPVSRR